MRPCIWKAKIQKLNFNLHLDDSFPGLLQMAIKCGLFTYGPMNVMDNGQWRSFLLFLGADHKWCSIYEQPMVTEKDYGEWWQGGTHTKGQKKM